MLSHATGTPIHYFVMVRRSEEYIWGVHMILIAIKNRRRLLLAVPHAPPRRHKRAFYTRITTHTHSPLLSSSQFSSSYAMKFIVSVSVLASTLLLLTPALAQDDSIISAAEASGIAAANSALSANAGSVTVVDGQTVTIPSGFSIPTDVDTSVLASLASSLTASLTGSLASEATSILGEITGAGSSAANTATPTGTGSKSQTTGSTGNSSSSSSAGKGAMSAMNGLGWIVPAGAAFVAGSWML
ncbi:hypothetical protein D9757_007370 [Collybiopsis confluens]|uniref:Uncharacterized protein n=1 Tax=Collybiopsis confluens TaxID=2823264 RepID=A0A8H5M7U3_9AGAR|nr:hypothetical protein D9757_007370 [Collybiopsis confluens]